MRITILFLIFFCFTHAFANDLAQQRKIFADAEHALKKHDLKTYQTLSKQVKNYPLYPYLTFADLKRQITNAKPNEALLKKIQAFESSHPDFPRLGQLRQLYLSQAAERKNWALYVKAYEGRQNEALQCYYHYGKYKVTQDVNRLKKAKTLWLTGESLPKSCDILFKEWQKHHFLTNDLIWQRFVLALDKKNEALLHHLFKLLHAKERDVAKTWDKLNQKPILLTSKKHFLDLKLSAASKKKIIQHILPKLAKQDADMALKWWETHSNKFNFSASQVQALKTSLAIKAAQQKHPLAEKWLASANQEGLVLEWKIRLAIWSKGWEKVLSHIEKLSPERQKESIWQYWRAKSYDALNEKEKAHAIYVSLAKERSYYGFLASLKLEKPITLAHQPINIDPEVKNKIAKLKNFKRFEELMALKRVSEARLEWVRATEHMTENEQLCAAKMAEKMGLHELAVRTIINTEYKNDVFLRYPLAYHSEIIKYAKHHQIDPGWVFAIARQESGFHTHAVSPVGARGLMQLMPGTAEILSKRHGIAFPSESILHKPDVNIQLGTVYLKNLYHRLYQHYVLTTASYNAGPISIKSWLPKNHSMSADLWIENIPYHETREYVKNVVMMTAIYRHQLGHPLDLNAFLKPIPTKTSS